MKFGNLFKTLNLDSLSNFNKAILKRKVLVPIEYPIKESDITHHYSYVLRFFNDIKFFDRLLYICYGFLGQTFQDRFIKKLVNETDWLETSDQGVELFDVFKRQSNNFKKCCNFKYCLVDENNIVEDVFSVCDVQRNVDLLSKIQTKIYTHPLNFKKENFRELMYLRDEDFWLRETTYYFPEIKRVSPYNIIKKLVPILDFTKNLDLEKLLNYVSQKRKTELLFGRPDGLFEYGFVVFKPYQKELFLKLYHLKNEYEKQSI